MKIFDSITAYHLFICCLYFTNWLKISTFSITKRFSFWRLKIPIVNGPTWFNCLLNYFTHSWKWFEKFTFLIPISTSTPRLPHLSNTILFLIVQAKQFPFPHPSHLSVNQQMPATISTLKYHNSLLNRVHTSVCCPRSSQSYLLKVCWVMFLSSLITFKSFLELE